MNAVIIYLCAFVTLFKGIVANLFKSKKEQKANEISEDEQKDAEAEVQKLTDQFVKKIDEMVESKSKEIMTV